MPSLKISLIESAYLIFMFLFFKTTMDFNVLRSPTGWWFEHLVGDHYGLRICPFGRVAIFALIAILIARHYIKIPQLFVNISLFIAFSFITNEYERSSIFNSYMVDRIFILILYIWRH